jgi:hypothetical protein
MFFGELVWMWGFLTGLVAVVIYFAFKMSVQMSVYIGGFLSLAIIMTVMVCALNQDELNNASKKECHKIEGGST